MPVLKNPRHEAFAQELAKGKAADEAYPAAGFSANRGNACRLKANESIRKRVAELQVQIAEVVVKSTGADLARVVKELERIAFSDIGNVVSWQPEVTETIDRTHNKGVVTVTRTVRSRVTVKPSSEIDEDTAAAVASVNLSASGTLSVKMHDKLAALRELLAYLDSRPPEQPSQNVPLIDAPPRETREEWLARRHRELANGHGGAREPAGWPTIGSDPTNVD